MQIYKKWLDDRHIYKIIVQSNGIIFDIWTDKEINRVTPHLVNGTVMVKIGSRHLNVLKLVRKLFDEKDLSPTLEEDIIEDQIRYQRDHIWKYDTYRYKIDDKYYKTLDQICKSINLTMSKVYTRLNSDKYPNFNKL